MTSRDFCFWLQGYFEIDDVGKLREDYSLTPKQAECIRKHLALVFKHEIDPSMGDEKHQAKLNEIHDAMKKVVDETPEDFRFNKIPGMRC